MSLRSDIQDAINKASRESESDTPDFILAEYLLDSLQAFEKAVRRRECSSPPSQGQPATSTAAAGRKLTRKYKDGPNTIEFSLMNLDGSPTTIEDLHLNPSIGPTPENKKPLEIHLNGDAADAMTDGQREAIRQECRIKYVNDSDGNPRFNSFVDIATEEPTTKPTTIPHPQDSEEHYRLTSYAVSTDAGRKVWYGWRCLHCDHHSELPDYIIGTNRFWPFVNMNDARQEALVHLESSACSR